ncbi:MAG TPA: peptidoglycan-binding protein [bacterium]|jgi:L,D-transpeptidase ErfK/SrfK|nr:peptidoglycan-binding protein [bacterium]
MGPRRGLIIYLVLAWLSVCPLASVAAMMETDPCGCEKVAILRLSSPPLRGPNVQQLQERLIQSGFYRGPKDGIYGPALAEAVGKMQMELGLSPSGEMDDASWQALALYEIHPVGAPTPAPEGEISLLVDIDALTLVIYCDNIPFKLYPVAVGRPESPTPAGEWIVCEKRAGWHGALGVRWLRLSNPWGSYGIHGTNDPGSIGQMASAGCIRMFNHDVIELYDWVKIGTPVRLRKGRRQHSLLSGFTEGTVGQEVVYLQWQLRELGFDPGRADGVYGESTAEAVAAWQNYHGLNATGIVTSGLLYILGLR